MNMDPLIAQKLAESNHISISKGKSVHLLVSTLTLQLTNFCPLENWK